MCGIFGFVTERPDVADRIDPAAALSALAHRGPDGSGQYRGEARGVRCALVHTRLAIIDLSEGGRQPMESGDGRYVITYNGEVYNHREVRHELERAGAQLRSSSDTEVILEAYARWGSGCLQRFRGMFAFAIWDNALGELFLARDRLGVKPLYIAQSAGTLVFSSEIRAFLAAGAVEPKLCPDGLRSYLEWGSVAEPATILRGAKALAPGTFLTFRNGQASTHTYWHPRTATQSHTFAEATEAVAPVLREAVRLRLVSDVPVGIFLSGGIDSSVITAIATAASSQRLHTFTIAFDEETMNEGDHAAHVSRTFGTEHHHILLRHERLRDELGGAMDALDQPSADGTNTFFVAKAVRASGISVALSGLGGDEVFAGYHYFRQFAGALRLAGKLPQRASSWLESAVSSPSLAGLPRWAPKLAALVGGPPGPTGAYSALRCMFTPSQVARLLAPTVAPTEGGNASPSAPAGDSEAPDAINLFSMLELSNYMRNTLLRDSDVMSMAHALEVRVPLLDHKLIETVLAIPGRLKLGRTTNKPLLVEASPQVPGQIVNRPKMGFTLPFDQWLRGPLRPRMDELLGPESVAKVGFLSVSGVSALWKAFLAHDRRVTFSRVWCIAALVAWCERNGAHL